MYCLADVERAITTCFVARDVHDDALLDETSQMTLREKAADPMQSGAAGVDCDL
eukprot:ANDGO_03651.mRNA.1 hypothetical protein